MENPFALFGAFIVFLIAIDSFPDFIARTVIGTIWLALSAALVAVAFGVNIPYI